VFTQHMPEHFTRSFAARLDRVGVVRVHEAAHGQPLLPGHALLAPGGQHLSVKRAGDQLIAQLSGEIAELDPWLRRSADSRHRSRCCWA